MYELKKNGKVFTSKLVGTGLSSYEKRIYRAAVLTKVEKHRFTQSVPASASLRRHAAPRLIQHLSKLSIVKFDCYINNN